MAALTWVQARGEVDPPTDGDDDGARMLGSDPAPADRSGIHLRRLLIELDAGCIAASWISAFWIGSIGHPLVGPAWWFVLATVVLTAAGVGLIALAHLYRSRVSSDSSVTIERLALVAVALAGGAWAFERAVASHPSVRVPLLGGVLVLVTLVLTRSCFDAWVTLLRRSGALSRPVVLVGTITEVKELNELLLGHPEIGYRAVGHTSDGPTTDPDLADLPWLGPISRCAQGVRASHATGAIIAANGISSAELNAIVRDLHRIEAHVHISSGIFRIGHQRVRQLPLAHEPFFYLEPAGFPVVELAAKRLIDIVGASVVLLLTAPITLTAAALIRLLDGKPVLFRQVRVGQHGQPVVIRKLRTMTVGAEAKVDSLRALNTRSGPLFKIDEDPRVTRLGRWLRASSIDELPQLLNVLEGSLSLVGPRPALAAEVAQFDDELQERQLIRPGVTGLWQVDARHNMSFYAYRHLDLFYLENWRLALDIAILVATARSLVSDAFAATGRIRDRHRPRPTADDTADGVASDDAIAGHVRIDGVTAGASAPAEPLPREVDQRLAGEPSGIVEPKRAGEPRLAGESRVGAR
jgi:exopolysaccharide biosynthesis polyprenyl glycosylphosphotransferase